jgi:hypothetical protein
LEESGSGRKVIEINQPYVVLKEPVSQVVTTMDTTPLAQKTALQFVD